MTQKSFSNNTDDSKSHSNEGLERILEQIQIEENMQTFSHNSNKVLYYIDNDGQMQGSVTGEQLEGLARQGTITPQTVIVPEISVYEHWDEIRKEVNATKFVTTPLHVAAVEENLEFAKLLVQNGADVHAKDTKGETPLHKAALRNKDTEFIKFLIAGGADVDAKDNNGETPLHRAEVNNNVKIIACLLNRGADIYARNKYGQTLLDRILDGGIIGQRQLNSDQMKDLQTMHERFSRKFAASLAAMLRTTVEVKLVSVDDLRYCEYIFSLDDPTCFNLLRVEPIEGNMFLDINPSIIYPMLDRMLGGDEWGWSARLYRQRPPRPLNEGELWFVRRITDEFLKELKHAWENELKLHFSVVQVESNPKIFQIVAPNEEIVMFGFHVEMLGISGAMSLCIPYDFFERIQKASSEDTSMGALLERTEQKLEEVSLLLSRIRQANNDQVSEPQS